MSGGRTDSRYIESGRGAAGLNRELCSLLCKTVRCVVGKRVGLLLPNRVVFSYKRNIPKYAHVLAMQEKIRLVSGLTS